MKIKEAEELTGLSAKTIRFYESEGLVHIKRNKNQYREYDNDNIDELKKIKILRNLDISINKIKDIQDGRVSLKNTLELEIERLNKKEADSIIKKSTIEIMLKDINKKGNIDILKYYEELEEINNDELTEFICDMNELKDISLSTIILYSLIFICPIIYFFSNAGNADSKSTIMSGVFLIISTIFLTLTWRRFLKQPNKKVKGTGFVFLSIIISVIIVIAIFVIITKIQEKILVPNDYLMYINKKPYFSLIYILEIEVLVFLISNIYRNSKNIEWRWTEDLIKVIKKNVLLTAMINLVIIYIVITGITVITKDEIIDHSFYNPIGTKYSLEEISKIDTGFKGKLFGTFDRGAGEFYYKIELKNGKKFNLYQAYSKFEDTYLEVEVFDRLIMDKYNINKKSSMDHYKMCDLDKRYVDRFIRIINNK